MTKVLSPVDVGMDGELKAIAKGYLFRKVCKAVNTLPESVCLS